MNTRLRIWLVTVFACACVYVCAAYLTHQNQNPYSSLGLQCRHMRVRGAEDRVLAARVGLHVLQEDFLQSLSAFTVFLL